MRLIPKVVALTISLVLCWAAAASAATLHPIGNFDQPIFVTSDPLDPNRLLVVEREGRVMLVDETGVHLYADLEALVSCCAGERGLLSIAAAPDFPSSGRIYAVYAGKPAAGGSEGDLHVDSFRPAPGGGGAVLRDPILTVGHAKFANHNGGQLELGPDGYLYVSTGDGGSGGDPDGNGQNLDSLLGKILRIDPRPGAEPPYVVPPDNPFVGQVGLDEIWSYGLRNPWRFSFDRTGGDLIIGDVGQGQREEIDLALSPAADTVGGAGANYGWNCREGLIAYPSAPAGCTGLAGFVDPVFDYPHSGANAGEAQGCAITGGYVVRDPSLGDLYGRYLYADFCVGDIRSLVLPASAGGRAMDDRSEGLSVVNPSSFGEDSCGRLYVSLTGGAVYRFEGATPSPCTVTPPTQPPPNPPEPPADLPGPATSPVGATSAPEPGPVDAGLGERPQIRLQADVGSEGKRRRVLFTVRVSPCPRYAGEQVQLNRGGAPVGRKRLNADCVARFHLRIESSSTFRALLPEGDYRSQVRTIALAKPRP